MALAETQFRWTTVLAVCFLGVFAYTNTFTGAFVWDDVSSVTLHKHVQDPSKFFELFLEDQHAFVGGQGNFYRPLLSASFMVDYALARNRLDEDAFDKDAFEDAGLEEAGPGEEAAGDEASRQEAAENAGPAPDGAVSPFLFHVTNLGWHLAATLLIFVLISRANAPPMVRFAVPVFYVIHPLHTEAVAYISGRADPMAAAFMFAGMWCAVWDKTPARRVAGGALSLVCFAAGLLSKESAMIYPVLLLLYILCVSAPKEGETSPNIAIRLAPFFASLPVLGGYLLLRTVGPLNFGSDSVPLDLSFVERLLQSLQCYALYLKLVFLPLPLHMERSQEWLGGVPLWTALAGAALLALTVGALVLALWRKQKRLALALGWFLATWLPISGIFPLNAPMAEHWMYVPLAGLLWAIAELLASLPRHPAILRGAVAAGYLWGVFLLAHTIERNRDWRDNESIYTATLRESPASVRVHYNLAVTYEDLLGNPHGARRHYDIVVRAYEEKRRTTPGSEARYWQDEISSHLSLGNLYRKQQLYPVAVQHYRVVLNVIPDENTQALVGLAAMGAGQCFLAVGNTEQATEHFRRALQLRPDLAPEIQRLAGPPSEV